MPAVKSVVVACNMITPYGWGICPCWKGLLSGKTAIRRLNRFATQSFQTPNAAIIDDLTVKQDTSLVLQMLTPLLSKAYDDIPDDAFLILATTTGEIDILEQSILKGEPNAAGSCPERLLRKVIRLSGIRGPGTIISAACASSSAAAANAAAMIRSGEHDCVLVVACDSVSEFVFSGFSSLMALDKETASPFDKNRRGLSLGEAAGFMVLMSNSRALKENRTIIGEIAGWGLTNDANHMTGPSRDGSGLALAIRNALRSAGISPDDVGSIAAHGTGTVFNDAMEIKAFKTVFGTDGLPAYSIKGGTGHTIGAAGLIEIIISFQTLKEKVIPPTVNMRDVDDEADGWIFSEPYMFDSAITVSTNSGFGGVNSAVVLKRWED